MVDSDSSGHIAVSPTVFYLLIGSALSGGLGAGTFLGPQADRQALQACYDNSQRAIEQSDEIRLVAVQHGGEIQALRETLLERTRNRYTDTDAKRDWREQDRLNEEILRRLNRLEQ